jgi:tRNA pseudouridine13 synthase
MASSNSPNVNMGPPRKRQKISSPPSTRNFTTTPQLPDKGVAEKASNHTQTVMSETGFQPEREAEVGILHFVNSTNVGFTGILKQRYVSMVSGLAIFWASTSILGGSGV